MTSPPPPLSPDVVDRWTPPARPRPATAGSADEALARADIERPLFLEAPTGIVLLDRFGRILDCNPAFATLVGRSRRQLLGWPLLALVAADDRAELGHRLHDLATAAQRTARVDAVRLPSAGDGERTLAMHIARADRHDEAGGIVVHCVDITERRRLETQIAQAQKLQTIGELTGGIVHDFNNLLQGILGSCELLAERHGPDDPSHHDISQIRAGAARAGGLIRQLLRFARGQALEPTPIAVAPALRDVAAMLERVLGAHVQLVLDIADDVGWVRLDPSHFDQIIVNLAVNARDAMPRGGRLSIRARTLSVTEAMAADPEAPAPGRYVEIRVEDTGHGIAPEHLPRIFQPFFTTKDPGQGTGLGLAIVDRLSREAGGRVSAASRLGLGTTLRVLLPRVERPGDALEDDASAVDEPSASLAEPTRVLLVDDEDTLRQLAARALRRQGFLVREAATAEAALEAAAREPVDVVVSDVILADLDGGDLALALRRTHPGLGIVLMSGCLADRAVPAPLAGDPRARFLGKPFSPSCLVAAVRELAAATA